MTIPTNLPTGGGSYQPEQHEVRGAARNELEQLYPREEDAEASPL